MHELYIGLMSGTSADGIDAALVDFSSNYPKLIGTEYKAYTPELRANIISLCQPGDNEISRLGHLDVLLGNQFAEVVNTLLKKQHISPSQIHAIGSHGQTIRHHPQQHFTLQIGDPNIITAKTGITTVADFRRRDIAYGGQGAPLVPAFHQHILSDPKQNRAIVNIGGIANVTLLSTTNPILGFDTGPGNTLLDAWIEKQLTISYDKNGGWAAQGQINEDLLKSLLDDPYFKLPTPKSTGREYFNLTWLEKYSPNKISAIDVQATLTALTAHTIVNAIRQYQPDSKILVCGGGVHNDYLMKLLSEFSQELVSSTQSYGVDPDSIEAMAFAWLAKQTINGKSGNLAAVTGANQATILGGIYRIQ